MLADTFCNLWRSVCVSFMYCCSTIIFVLLLLTNDLPFIYVYVARVPYLAVEKQSPSVLWMGAFYAVGLLVPVIVRVCMLWMQHRVVAVYVSYVHACVQYLGLRGVLAG